MSEEVKSVLERLKEINESKSNNIYLPSIGKKCKFSPFTLKQQKDLLEKFREIENEKSNPSIKKFFQKAKSFWKN